MGGIMINWDDTNFYGYDHYLRNTTTKEEMLQKIERVITQYQDHHITDFMICILSRLSTCPSQHFTTFEEKYHRKKEQGKDVDYSNYSWIFWAHEISQKWGIDLIETWINQLRKINIKPWLSYRMNDAHDVLAETSPLAPDFWYEHPEYYRIRHHKGDDWQAYNYDYEIEAVRNRYLAYIDETLDRYDPDGIELDWMREIRCFRHGRESVGVDIINDFMCSVKAITNKHALKRGHKIEICVRVPASVETAYNFGFDVLHWVQEGIVDVINITSRWETTDHNMPVEIWKRLLVPYPHVLLAVGVECLVRENETYPLKANTFPTVNAVAAAHLSCGADKLYLFNYMSIDEDTLFEYQDHGIFKKIFLNSWSSETAILAPRHHLVTYRDVLPVGEKNYYQVPRTISALPDPYFGKVYEKFCIRTGPVVHGSPVRMLLAIQSETSLCPEDVEAYFNCTPVHMSQTCHETCDFSDLPLYTFELHSDFVNNTNVFEISSNGPTFEIVHIELRVN